MDVADRRRRPRAARPVADERAAGPACRDPGRRPGPAGGEVRDARSGATMTRPSGTSAPTPAARGRRSGADRRHAGVRPGGVTVTCTGCGPVAPTASAAGHRQFLRRHLGQGRLAAMSYARATLTPRRSRPSMPGASRGSRVTCASPAGGSRMVPQPGGPDPAGAAGARGGRSRRTRAPDLRVVEVDQADQPASSPMRASKSARNDIDGGGAREIDRP